MQIPPRYKMIPLIVHRNVTWPRTGEVSNTVFWSAGECDESSEITMIVLGKKTTSTEGVMRILKRHLSNRSDMYRVYINRPQWLYRVYKLTRYIKHFSLFSILIYLLFIRNLGEGCFFFCLETGFFSTLLLSIEEFPLSWSKFLL